MRWPKWPRWVWQCLAATFAAVGAFLVCSFLPMWRVAEQEDLGAKVQFWVYDHSLWGMLGSNKPHHRTDRSFVIWYWENPATNTAVAVPVAAVLGAILGGMRWRRWPRWVWRCYAAAFAGVGAFLVCSFYPMWVVMYYGDWEATGEGYTLWEMVSRIEPAPPPGKHAHAVLEWETPATITAVAVHVAAIVGALLGGIRWRRPGPPAADEIPR